MSLLIEEKSTLTAKGQTTVPKVVREALGVRSGDQIAYRVDSEGKVTLSRHEAGSDEAAIDSFLAFLSEDIKRRPEAVTRLSDAAAQRRRALVAGIEADPDADLSGATPI